MNFVLHTYEKDGFMYNTTKGHILISPIRRRTNLFVVSSFDIDNKIVLLERIFDYEEYLLDNLGNFHSSLVTLLRSFKIGDVIYRLKTKDYNKSGFMGLNLQSLETPKDYTDFSISSSSYYMHNRLWWLQNKEKDTPDFYICVEYPELRVSAIPKEDTADIIDVSVIDSNNYSYIHEARKDIWRPYTISSIRKYTKELSLIRAPHFLRITTYLTRNGNYLSLGNTEKESSQGLGLIGYKIPYYFYPKLKDGETELVNINCKEILETENDEYDF